MALKLLLEPHQVNFAFCFHCGYIWLVRIISNRKQMLSIFNNVSLSNFGGCLGTFHCQDLEGVWARFIVKIWRVSGHSSLSRFGGCLGTLYCQDLEGVWALFIGKIWRVSGHSSN